jgi:arsenite-transporting ATPase
MGGLDLLRRMGMELFADRDPTDQWYKGETQTLEPISGGGYSMRIPLPLADKAKIDLYRAADELTLTVGAYHRNIVLPRVLWPLEIKSAQLRDGILVVSFVEQKTE